MSLGSEYGGALYRARGQHKLTQAQVAERCRISTRWYQRMEKGDVQANFGDCLRLAAALGIDLNAFMEETIDLEETLGCEE